MRKFVVMLVTALAGMSVLSACAADPGRGLKTIEPVLLETVDHDPSRFTQGFQMRDGLFVESTGLEGQSKLVVWQPSDGKVVKQVELPPNVFGEGLAFGDQEVYVLTWKNHQILRYSWPDLEPMASLPLDTEGWGACTDDGLLWTSDGSATLSGRNPETGKTVRKIEVTDKEGPVRKLNELECFEGHAWANVWQSNKIVSFKLDDGKVFQVIDASALAEDAGKLAKLGHDDVLNGIAFTAEGDVWLTGKRWPKVYHVTFAPEN